MTLFYKEIFCVTFHFCCESEALCIVFTHQQQNIYIERCEYEFVIKLIFEWDSDGENNGC